MHARPTLLVAALAVTLVLSSCDDAEPANGDVPAADAAEVTVRAVEAGPFEDAPATVPAGQLDLRLVNEDGMGHSLRIDELDDGVDLVAAGEEGTATVTFEAGETYTYYCDVPGHRGLGMEGEFRAEA